MNISKYSIFYFLGFLSFLIVLFLCLFTRKQSDNESCNNITPTLTGEYGNPDGWETLTGPYVE